MTLNGMRCALLLAGLWAASASAVVPAPAADDLMAHARTCAEATAVFEQAPSRVSPSQTDRLNAICDSEREAADLAADPELYAQRKQWERMYAQALALHLRGLMASTDPRDLLAAAMLALIGSGIDPAERPVGSVDPAEAYAAAQRLGPGDRLVAWMEMLDCPTFGQEVACDPDAARQRLQRMEPRNAAVILHGLNAAVERGDERAVEHVLARAAAASDFEIPVGEIARMLYDALQSVDAPPLPPRLAADMGEGFGLERPATLDDHAELSAMGLTIAVATPGYGTLSQVCGVGADTPVLPHRRPECISIYTAMARDPLLISQMISLTSLARLTHDMPEGPAWRERLRTLLWVQARSLESLGSNVPEGYLQSAWRDGERVAMEAALTSKGIPTTPPSDWLPDSAHHRALVTTGRVPVQRLR